MQVFINHSVWNIDSEWVQDFLFFFDFVLPRFSCPRFMAKNFLLVSFKPCFYISVVFWTFFWKVVIFIGFWANLLVLVSLLGPERGKLGHFHVLYMWKQRKISEIIVLLIILVFNKWSCLNKKYFPFKTNDPIFYQDITVKKSIVHGQILCSFNEVF